jgi:hypothetical protein
MDRRILVLAAALLAGCANSPTATTRGGAPVRFDAGVGWSGSGNHVEAGARSADHNSGSDGVIAASGEAAPAVGDSTSAAGAGRGGGSFGSGN